MKVFILTGGEVGKSRSIGLETFQQCLNFDKSQVLKLLKLLRAIIESARTQEKQQSPNHSITAILELLKLLELSNY